MFTLDTLHSELRDEKYRLLLEEGKTHENPNKIDTLVSILFRGYLLSEVINFLIVLLYICVYNELILKLFYYFLYSL